MPDLIRHPEVLKLLDSRFRGNDEKGKFGFVSDFGFRASDFDYFMPGICSVAMP
ncbi:MAG: hypothetical protein K9K88_06880 [Desulfobacterales bacterium]|nr:hypothetical protein [Desulfobacterales bacterium]